MNSHSVNLTSNVATLPRPNIQDYFGESYTKTFLLPLVVPSSAPRSQFPAGGVCVCGGWFREVSVVSVLVRTQINEPYRARRSGITSLSPTSCILVHAEFIANTNQISVSTAVFGS